jgi:hypothetical protein
MMRLHAWAARANGPCGLSRSQRPRAHRLVLAALLTCILLLSGRAPVWACVGDCDSDGHVTVNELVTMVNVALGTASASACSAGDANDDGYVRIDELIAAVNNALNGCGPVPTFTPTDTATASPTPTETPPSTSTASATPTPGSGMTSVADAVARDAQGMALHLGQSLTTEAVVTVSAGLFAGNKLKIFMQSSGAGIMVFHQSAGAVPAFQAGDLLRATGVIRQADPTGGDNLAEGTVLVDITTGTAIVLSTGNPLPEPTTVTLDGLVANGVALTGTLVHVPAVHKVSGNWPQLGDKTTEVTVADESGTTLIVRFQRVTITPELVNELQAIGDGFLNLAGVVVQDDRDISDGLLSDFAIWPRGGEDIAASP